MCSSGLGAVPFILEGYIHAHSAALPSSHLQMVVRLGELVVSPVMGELQELRGLLLEADPEAELPDLSNNWFSLAVSKKGGRSRGRKGGRGRRGGHPPPGCTKHNCVQQHACLPSAGVAGLWQQAHTVVLAAAFHLSAAAPLLALQAA
jgi:hypothetical protein